MSCSTHLEKMIKTDNSLGWSEFVLSFILGRYSKPTAAPNQSPPNMSVKPGCQRPNSTVGTEMKDIEKSATWKKKPHSRVEHNAPRNQHNHPGVTQSGMTTPHIAWAGLRLPGSRYRPPFLPYIREGRVTKVAGIDSRRRGAKLSFTAVVIVVFLKSFLQLHSYQSISMLLNSATPRTQDNDRIRKMFFTWPELAHLAHLAQLARRVPTRAKISPTARIYTSDKTLGLGSWTYTDVLKALLILKNDISSS
ncbi:hypothetical protein B0H16DRAFT_1468050 [Mycena metata]|nr:hypothetical protein B0H16DRAFT_1468050 [Mycena metata]